MWEVTFSGLDKRISLRHYQIIRPCLRLKYMVMILCLKMLPTHRKSDSPFSVSYRTLSAHETPKLKKVWRNKKMKPKGHGNTHSLTLPRDSLSTREFLSSSFTTHSKSHQFKHSFLFSSFFLASDR